MKTRSILTAFLCFTGLNTFNTALAVPITFHFEGTVDFVQGELASELLAPGWTGADLLGTDFHGSYTFDSDASDASADPRIGSYSAAGAPFGMEFHFDHRSFFFEGITIGITNDVDLPASVTPMRCGSRRTRTDAWCHGSAAASAAACRCSACRNRRRWCSLG